LTRRRFCFLREAVLTAFSEHARRGEATNPNGAFRQTLVLDDGENSLELASFSLNEVRRAPRVSYSLRYIYVAKGGSDAPVSSVIVFLGDSTRELTVGNGGGEPFL